ncbi:MAG: pilus assembly protein [Pseudorhodobacter sp.]|nr:pilus assembly protein [Pseudorhodobacter sp.]
MTRLSNWLRSASRREDGTATMEFALMIPLLLMVFMASFESGLLMVRHTMLERAVDMTMRELRLGHFVNPDHDLLKTEICARTVIIADCEAVIKITLQPVDTTTWALPDSAPVCADRAEPIQPLTEVNAGLEDQIMLVRVCVVVNALFPTTGIGLALPKDGLGGYGLVAESAFVNEPA